MVYDRAAKRKAQGKSWQGKTGVRVERRIKKNLALPIKDLSGIANPFDPLMFVALPLNAPGKQVKMGYVWDLFRRAVEVEGLVGALALLPEEKRTLYREHFEAHQLSFWNPAGIWAHWRPMLKELGLTDPNAWPL